MDHSKWDFRLKVWDPDSNCHRGMGKSLMTIPLVSAATRGKSWKRPRNRSNHRRPSRELVLSRSPRAVQGQRQVPMAPPPTAREYISRWRSIRRGELTFGTHQNAVVNFYDTTVDQIGGGQGGNVEPLYTPDLRSSRLNLTLVDGCHFLWVPLILCHCMKYCLLHREAGWEVMVCWFISLIDNGLTANLNPTL